MKLSQLAQSLGLERRGEDVEVAAVAPVEEAGAGVLTFAAKAHLLERAAAAAAVVTTPDLAERTDQPRLLSPTPSVDVGRAGLLLGMRQLALPAGVHPSAAVDPTARLAADVAVGPLAVIGPEAVVGARSVIHAGAVIQARCEIGADCIIHSNAVIGADGYGYEFADGDHHRIPHLGHVVIEDGVEVGAGTTIDRARFGATRIGAGTKIDNLVQIAHNVQVGRKVLIVGQAGVAGSCVIGDGVVLAGQCGVTPHVRVGAGARVAGGTGVVNDVPPGGTVSGWWGQEHRRNLSEMSAVRKLPAFMKQVRDFLKKQGVG